MTRPEKIVLVGISGTGKSVLGRRLAEKTGLPLYHMDAMIWGPGWTETAEASVRAALSEIAAGERWIIEGWIDLYSMDILRRSDVILYLDYPGWRAALGGLRRWWTYKGKRRPEMPEGCMENFDLRYLRTMFLRKERPHVETMLAEIPQIKIVRLRTRRETDKVLSEWTQ